MGQRDQIPLENGSLLVRAEASSLHTHEIILIWGFALTQTNANLHFPLVQNTDRVAIFEKVVANLKKIEKNAEMRRGLQCKDVFLHVQAARLKAEIRLLREKTRVEMEAS